eukprot:16431006-Heterocapsa_arctica.AAC.1
MQNLTARLVGLGPVAPASRARGLAHVRWGLAQRGLRTGLLRGGLPDRVMNLVEVAVLNAALEVALLAAALLPRSRLSRRLQALSLSQARLRQTRLELARLS